MKIQLDTTAGNVIRAYTPGRITVNQEVYTESLIVCPDQIVAPWHPARFDQLTAADVEAICELRPEVVLLGTGPRLQFPAPALMRPLVVAQIGFEIMDTGAACRTYNVLMSEGRHVAAALLIEK